MSLLVGVDPARRSSSALTLGAQLANSLGTDLVVAAVVSGSWPHPHARGADHEWRAHNRDAADLVLDHAASVLGGQVEARFVTHDASSARRGILELVDELDPELLLVGSAAGGERGRVALGAVSEALLHASPVPVALAPAGYRAPLDSRVARVTVGYGGSDAAHDLVRSAAPLAARAHADLRVASFAVRPESEFGILAGAGGRAEDPVLREWSRSISAHVAQLIDDIETLTPRPTIEDAVIGVGESWADAVQDIGWEDGDLLVLGSSSLNPLTRVFLGTRATKIVRSATVPVVVVPRAALPSSA
ncbi:universal stress protein [Microbacterium sp. 22242]|uniref:universal stress protein n=1 Tax=Microbacterium sp. 22242 TaxID=3453896 RepID=UPI003F87F5C1